MPRRMPKGFDVNQLVYSKGINIFPDETKLEHGDMCKVIGCDDSGRLRVHIPGQNTHRTLETNQVNRAACATFCAPRRG